MGPLAHEKECPAATPGPLSDASPIQGVLHLLPGHNKTKQQTQTGRPRRPSLRHHILSLASFYGHSTSASSPTGQLTTSSGSTASSTLPSPTYNTSVSALSVPTLHTRSRTNSLKVMRSQSYSSQPHSPCSSPTFGHATISTTNTSTLGSFIPSPTLTSNAASCAESLRHLTKRLRTESLPEEYWSAPRKYGAMEPLRPSLKDIWSWSSGNITISRRLRSNPSSIPSLSRTQSPERDYTNLPSTPPSPTKLPSSSNSPSSSYANTPSLSPPSSPKSASSHFSRTSLDSRLAALEKASRLKARIVCATCRKVGDDYPRCGRCGMAWCSRSCRMRNDKGKGKRHVC